jgi:hypothetical protein
MFPGLFNDCGLYVNGIQVAQRGFDEPWWLSEYRFERDVALNDGCIKAPTRSPFAVTITIIWAGCFDGHFSMLQFRLTEQLATGENLYSRLENAALDGAPSAALLAAAEAV